jgi:hypothetical protein
MFSEMLAMSSGSGGGTANPEDVCILDFVFYSDATTQINYTVNGSYSSQRVSTNLNIDNDAFTFTGRSGAYTLTCKVDCIEINIATNTMTKYSANTTNTISLSSFSQTHRIIGIIPNS